MRKHIKRISCLIIVCFLIMTTGIIHALPGIGVPSPFLRESTIDIKDVRSLKDTDPYKNPAKVWSVCKGLGMSDEAAAGLLGNMQQESGFDPTCVETVFDEPFSINGEKKQLALNDPSKFVPIMFDTYRRSGRAIIGATDDTGLTIPSSGGESPINVSAYKGEDGKFYPGIGLLGYTGPATSRFYKWAKKHRVPWYDMDYALAYVFTTKDEYSYAKAKWAVEEYAKTDFSSPEEAAELWCRKYEGVSVELPNRTSYARTWYNKFKGTLGDQSYAKMILQYAEAPMLLKNGSDEITDYSILHTIASPVLEYKPNVGFLIDFKGKRKDLSHNVSEMIFNHYSKPTPKDGEQETYSLPTVQYSLYDLFGEDIHFFRYFGEATQPIKLYDHIYSAYDQNKLNKIANLGNTIYYESTRYLSCNVYKNRPTVLTMEDTGAGLSDPRVNTLYTGWFTGASYTVAEAMLSFSKLTVSTVNSLMSPDLLIEFKDMLDIKLNSKLWFNVIAGALRAIMGLAICVFIISMTKKSIDYFYKGNMHKTPLIKRFVVGFLIIGLYGTLLIRSSTLLGVVFKTAISIEQGMSLVVNELKKDDKVISSDNGETALAASLWKTAVFEPWCLAIFNKPYEQLYTQQSDKAEKDKFKQSYTPKENRNGLAPSDYVYSSAEYTGDVYVPIGKGEEEHNWGAFLYSCGSAFHIDQSLLDKRSYSPIKGYPFPTRLTTAGNPNLSADTFRVIDALYDISPQIYGNGNIVNNYTGASIPELHYEVQARRMVILSVLLFCSLIPLIIKKLRCFLKLGLSSALLVITLIAELFKEGYIIKYWDDFINDIFEYLYTLMKLMVMVLAYINLAGKSPVTTFVYIVLILVIYGVKVEHYSEGKEKLVKMHKKLRRSKKHM